MLNSLLNELRMWFKIPPTVSLEGASAEVSDSTPVAPAVMSHLGSTFLHVMQVTRVTDIFIGS